MRFMGWWWGKGSDLYGFSRIFLGFTENRKVELFLGFSFEVEYLITETNKNYEKSFIHTVVFISPELLY